MINSFDLLNYFLIFNILFVFFIFKSYNFYAFLLLSLFSLSPFFIHFLIPASTMPDQYLYHDLISFFRSLSFDKSKILCHYCFDSNVIYGSGYIEYYDPNIISFDNNIGISAIIYSLVPIPYIESLISIGFINKFIYLSFIIYFLKNKIFNQYIFIILILYPSAILYSSLALRDILIVFCMVFYIFNFINKRYILSAFFIIILFLIKFQNAFILILLSYLYLIFFNKRFRYILLSLIFLFGPIFSSQIYNLYNKLEETKYALFVENIIQSNPDNLIKQAELINQLPDYNKGESILSFNILDIIKSPLNFMFSPKINEIKSLFEYLQYFENIAVLFILMMIIYYSFKGNTPKTFFWIFGLLFSFYLYGLISYNAGTVARYRFPFIVFFIFVFYYDCIFNKKKIL